MAQFTIDLPGNLRGNVRSGRIIRKRVPLFKLWQMIKRTKIIVDNEERLGYIVNIEPSAGNRREYFLCRRNDDKKWLTAEEKKMIMPKEKWPELEEDDISAEIKKAIDKYENKQ